MTARRLMESSLKEAKAGCQNCHGGNTEWIGKNAVAVAARHHDQTGHTTWAEQTTRTVYGKGKKQPSTEPRMI